MKVNLSSWTPPQGKRGLKFQEFSTSLILIMVKKWRGVPRRLGRRDVRSDMSPSHAWLSHFIVEEVVLPLVDPSGDGEFSPQKVACSILGQLLLLEWVGFVLFKPKNVFAWRILWTEEPGRLQSIGLHRVGHNWKLLSMHTSKNVFISVSPCCSSPLGLKPALGDSKGTLWGFEGAGSGKLRTI